MLDELVNYPVEYWGEHLPTVRQELSARMDNTVEDDTEWKVFQRLAKDLRSRCDELPRISPNDDSVN